MPAAGLVFLGGRALGLGDVAGLSSLVDSSEGPDSRGSLRGAGLCEKQEQMRLRLGLG